MMSNFFKEETGAITVDWVVLTAALVGLGLAVLTVVGDGVNSSANATADAMADDQTIMAAANVTRGGGVSTLGDWVAFAAEQGDPTLTYESFVASAVTGGDPTQLRNDAAVYAAFAADSANSTNDRAVHADGYAAVYGELQNQGEDVSGMPDPADVNASATSS